MFTMIYYAISNDQPKFEIQIEIQLQLTINCFSACHGYHYLELKFKQ